jgi:hypothetical protein
VQNYKIVGKTPNLSSFILHFAMLAIPLLIVKQEDRSVLHSLNHDLVAVVDVKSKFIWFFIRFNQLSHAQK